MVKCHASMWSSRIDLHCHSRASTEADEALLKAICCPESFSEPRQIHALARRRRMDFVTITDHDSIDGVAELRDLDDVVTGEEVTCYFPEDHCKIHVLVWGLNAADHDALQASADNIYGVADYIARHNLAHAVAHPLYRQNGRLSRWHIERLLLLFKGFECLNGAHSMRHREAFEPLLDELREPEILRLERIHRMQSLWPRPWIKSRTGGSDDHGLLNIGLAWTEFPEDVRTIERMLQCLKEGRCRPGGEAGSSIKLAHNFFSVGMRYFTQQPNSAGAARTVVERLLGERRPSRSESFRLTAVKYAGRFLAKISGFRRSSGGGATTLANQVTASLLNHLGDSGAVIAALRQGRPVLGEHQSFFDLVCRVNRDLSGGLIAGAAKALQTGQGDGACNAVSAAVARQVLLWPYYFALFHQNQERHLLASMTGRDRLLAAAAGSGSARLRVGFFTDSLDATDSAGGFAASLASFAAGRGWDLVVASIGRNSTPSATADFQDAGASRCGRFGGGQRVFVPQAVLPIAGANFAVPPVLEILEWSDRQQFDVVISNTLGPMGLCGWLVSRMLRAPLLAVHHEDFSARVLGLTGGDYRLGAAATAYAQWIYGSATRVMARSRAGQTALHQMPVALGRTMVLPPGPTHPANPAALPDDAFWANHGVPEAIRVVVPADMPIRRDAELIATAMRNIRAQRPDVALVLVGTGPWHSLLHDASDGRGIRNWPAQVDPAAALARADLLLFPDTADLSAQRVVDAQSCGVPAIVSAGSAASEMVDDEVTGLVLPARNPAAWGDAIAQLLADPARLARLARTARLRAQRLAGSRAFELIWQTCEQELAADAMAHDAAALRHHAAAPRHADTSEASQPC